MNDLAAKASKLVKESAEEVVSVPDDEDGPFEDASSQPCDRNEGERVLQPGAGGIDKAVPSSSRNFIPLPNTVLICDRFVLSDRSAAAVANAVLQDVGFLSEANPSIVVDRHKLRRERQRVRKALQKGGDESSLPILGVYFDGRKDKTLSQSKDGDKYHRRVRPEEHISIVKEPGSVNWGHVTPFSGKALSISNSITSFLQEEGSAFDDIKAAGCDLTPVNTGQKGGVIREVEKELGGSYNGLCACFILLSCP